MAKFAHECPIETHLKILKQPLQIGGTEEVDPDIENIGLERERGQRHITAVTRPDDSDTIRIHVRERAEVFLCFNPIPERFATMLLVIGGFKAPAEPRAATEIDR